MADPTSSAAYVNAFVEGADVVLLRRAGGRLLKSTVRGDHALFLERDVVDADLERNLRGSQAVKSVRLEGPWVRLGFVDERARNVLAGGNGFFASKGMNTFEADVDAITRLMIDSGAKVQRPERCYLDIETDSRVGFARARKGEARVLSWAVTDDAGNAASALLEEDSDEAEGLILQRLWEHLAIYDQVLAWNGDWFDFPVIQARSDRLNLRFDPRRWLWLDHMALFKRMNMHAAESGDEKQSMKLERIAMATLGEGKDEFDSSRTWESWEMGGEERQRLLRYNIKDTDLLRRLEAKTGFALLFDTVCEACGVFPDSRSLNPSIQVDSFMLRLGQERGVHFPTRRYREVIEKFKGAYVMEPNLRGIGRGVHVGDFKSLYPSIMLTWNMSPETKRDIPINGPIPVGHARCPLTGTGFDVEATGIITIALRHLLGLRVFWNDRKKSLPPGSAEWHDADRRSTAYKVVANTFYGVVGAPFSRFFSRAIAEGVTQNGKWLIQMTIHAAEERGWKVVYADTDSLFVVGCTRTAFEEFVRWCNSDLYPKIIASAGCKVNEIKLAYEKAFERIVFVSAKRYAGAYSHYGGTAPKPLPGEGEAYDPERHSHPEVKGLEYKRGDASLIARRMQEQVIGMLMRGVESPTSFRELIDKRLAHVLHEPLERDEVVVAKSLTKPIKDYKVSRKVKMDGTAAALPPHVQVAQILEDRKKVPEEGAKIEYFTAAGDGKKNRVLPIADYGDVEADRYYLWENLVYPPTMRLLQSAFPEADWETGYARVRPTTPRKKDKVLKGQIELGLPTGPRGPVVDASPVEVRIDDGFGEGFLEEVASIARAYPGARPLRIALVVDGGTAILDSRLAVSGSSEFFGAVERARLCWAAWMEACVA